MCRRHRRGSASFRQGVACADYDRDGRPDLYLSCLDGKTSCCTTTAPSIQPSEPAALEVQRLSQAAGVSDTVLSFATWFFDYDNDGYGTSSPAATGSGMSATAADYLGLPHEGALTKLYHNNGNGHFPT